MKNALFQNKKQLAPVRFVTGLFLILTILVNPLTVFAESSSEYSIPYNVSNHSVMNSAMLDNVDLAIQYYNSINNNPSYDSILVWSTDGIINGYYAYIYTIMVDPYCTENYPSNYDFSTNKVRLKSDSQITNIYISYSSLQHTGTTTIGTVYDLLGVPQTINYTVGDCTVNYPFYYSGDPILDSDGDELIVNRTSSIIIQGHATEPNPTTSFLGNNADFGASISSYTFPSVPTVSHYNPNTYNPPSIDNSSVTSLLESIIDLIQYNLTYIVNSIQGFVSSIITTIESYGQYVGSIIAYVGKAIITNIQYAIRNLYENIVSLFEPILNFIAEVLTGIKSIVDQILLYGTDQNGDFSLTTLFVNLAIPDSEDLQDLIEDSDTFNVISVFSTINTKVRQEYATLQGLTSQKIIHVPSCIYHGQEIGDYDIDFSWYDRYKTLGDGIISAFLIWNYLWFLFFRFPYWLRGNSGDFSGIPPKGSD